MITMKALCFVPEKGSILDKIQIWSQISKVIVNFIYFSCCPLFALTLFNLEHSVWKVESAKKWQFELDENSQY